MPPSNPPIIFIHGLGSTSEIYTPLIQSLGLETTHSLHLFDTESHGLSPSSPLSKPGIALLAQDMAGIFSASNIAPKATIIARSMGCPAAVHFALTYPDKLEKLILIGPPPSPLSDTERDAAYARAETVRSKGMQAIVDVVVSESTSEQTRKANLLAVAAIRMSLLRQDPEGYAKGYAALAEVKDQDWAALQAKTLIVTGSMDKVSSPELCEKYVQMLGDKASLQVLENVGHWHVLEDVQGTAGAVEASL